MIIFDSYAWVEYFIGSEKGAVAKEYLEGDKIVTPDVVLAEIARKYLREGLTVGEVKGRVYFIAARSEVEAVDADIALAAAEAWKELQERARKRKLRAPSLTDGIVLALARRHGAKVLTGDEHFKGMEEAIMLL